jgi:hypothetical protein
MSYNVYRVSYAGLPRDHHAIFVEMNSDLSGHVFQVTGNIQSGMIHNDKPAKKPEESATYQSKEFIGKVAAADFVRIKPTCESVPAPRKQFEGPRRLYPNEPLRRCQEWTQEAVNALVSAGILKK